MYLTLLLPEDQFKDPLFEVEVTTNASRVQCIIASSEQSIP